MLAPILVVGSFVQDLTFFVDRFPAAGETLIGNFETGPGGKGSNQAVAAARAGGATTFVGAVGYDAFGDKAATFLTEENVEHHLLKVANFLTGTAGITVNAEGQNQIVVALGASEQFTESEIDPTLFAAAEVIVLQLEIALATVAGVLKLARAAGKTTILNPAPMNPALDFTILSDVDIFIPNETEFVSVIQRHPAISDTAFSLEKLALLTDVKLHELCRQIAVPNVIVTLGNRGCFISQSTGFTHIPACEDLCAIDTTGAGDAFVGGFAAGMVSFAGDILSAARYGTVVAGLSVTKRGTARSMPIKTEIDAYLASI